VRVDVRRALEPFAAARASGSALGPDLDPQQLWAALEAGPAWRDWQEGRMTPRQWHEHLTGRLGMVISFEEFRDAWNRALDPNTILGDEFFAALVKRAARRSSRSALHLRTAFHRAHLLLRRRRDQAIPGDLPRRAGRPGADAA
jgi:hypothetical protein